MLYRGLSVKTYWTELKPDRVGDPDNQAVKDDRIISLGAGGMSRSFSMSRKLEWSEFSASEVSKKASNSMHA